MNLKPSHRKALIGFVVLMICAAAGAQTPWHEQPIDELHQQLVGRQISAEALTAHFLDRIDTLDAELASVLALDPTALDQARALDEHLAGGGEPGPLHGIPILLKDNIETRDQPTSAGSLALSSNHTGRDAPLVARLRAAGAVILGKTNLSEWANFRGERSSSGWSALGGQTRNPYDLTRTPCGSSAGSGAAVAAGFAPVAIGTETNGSIVCPASANGNAGIKPTVGLVSRTHIVPISHSQDTAGPMAMDLADATRVLAASMGVDPADEATSQRPDWRAEDLLAALDNASLEGLRIGVMRGLSDFHPDVNQAYDQAVAQLREAGAEIIDEVSLEWPDGFWDDTYTVLLHEFRHALNAYLGDLPDTDLSQLDLAALIEFNQQHAELELPWFGQEHFERAEETSGIESEEYLEALARVHAATRADGIDRLLAEHEVDLLISPSGGPAWKIDWINGDHFGGGSSTPAAVSGYPAVTVPMGLVHGLPVGLSFFAGRYSEPTLIRAARAFELQRGAVARPSARPGGTP
ncbi:amidase [Wenzhouxiangella limi]|uniref:Amidase n=1 Tax=Wenzhouxiangella limi TaxID=2707351 RepID=A0A845UVD8_9GAMM|nr:amidase [Wenzhouxiangella limi]NDY94172.1 amidase [Wenzhouxiangella limi]